MEVCLVVRRGTDATGLLLAVQEWSPDAELLAVWADDPHLRPAPPRGARWIDIRLDEPSGVGWNRLLTCLLPESYSLARSAQAVARRLRSGGGPVLVLHVGDVAVVAPLTAAPVGDEVAVVERCVDHDDGLSPTLADFLDAGRFSTAVLGFGDGAAPIAESIAATVVGAPGPSPGRLLELAIARAGSPITELNRSVALGWGERDRGISPVILDVSLLDRDEPWHLRVTDHAPRSRLSGDLELLAQIQGSSAQWNTRTEAVRLPGGIEVDATIRSLMTGALTAWRRGERALPPDPYGAEPSQFVAWLETPWPPWGADVGRYWTELRRRRADLVEAFPEPEGTDLAAFADWVDRNSRSDTPTPLLRSGAGTMRPAWIDADRRPGGVNLIGYPGTSNSLGGLARRFDQALTAGGIPHQVIDYQRSGSPRTTDGRSFDTELVYDTNLVVVNPDQLAMLDHDQGPALWSGRHTVGFWHWDVEFVPDHIKAAAAYVDEIWVLTEFTAASMRAACDRPVRVMCVTVPEPSASSATRADFGLHDDRFAFLVTLDHLSVTERKNPVGAIEAFRMAFPEPTDEGPVLIVKTINADQRWWSHERLLVAAGGRPDVIVLDRFVDRPDQMALVRNCDCLVSLHRSEGLGLHLMEAMWFAKPVIATRYSGNLSFMNDDNSALVDAKLVPVMNGEGYFPPEAWWAGPDLVMAADWMRRIAADPLLGDTLGAAARRRMLDQDDFETVGRRIAEWCGITDRTTKGSR